MYWPMFVVAVLAAIIASQAMISATFSIIQQSLSLGCFPRVKIVHTSAKYEGQAYIPEINYFLMLAFVGVTLGFRTTAKIGNAYVLIMIMIWKIHMIFAISYIVIIGALELLFLTSVLYKFSKEAILISIMFVWNNVFGGKYYYELVHKVSSNKLKEILDDTRFCCIPRLALFYLELVHGIPPIFKHYAANVPTLHSVLIFVSIKTLPVSKFPVEEWILFCRVEPEDLNVFQCVVRYGYTDEPFEKILVERLKEFISDDFWLSQRMLNNGEEDREANDEMKQVEEMKEEENKDVKEVEEVKGQEVVKREVGEVDKAWNSGVVHLIGEGEVVTSKGASIGKRILIDYVYNFLTRNLR
ncbi:potassium transporter 5 [Quercus suber]|uniref:Potassium transporter 5 n=1 Tax=Quercus suber TaxID=58331 RepID=A0AAW0JQ55_QUESU